MVIADWFVAGRNRVHREGQFTYLAIPAVSGHQGRWHCFAIPEVGLPVPVRIGNEIPLQHCCQVVQWHQEMVAEKGIEQTTAYFFKTLENDVAVLRGSS